jgi:hypothetical protein
MFAATPADPRPDTLGEAFDAGERQILLDRLTNLDTATRSALQSKLKKSVGQFDSALLSYMRNRNGPKFFFDPANIGDVGQFILSNNVDYSDVQTHSNAIADSHVFPEQSSSGDYTIREPAQISWPNPPQSTNPEFKHSMERMAWWIEMAWMNAIQPDPKYGNEIAYELASWSQQFPTITMPTSWTNDDAGDWPLDNGLRAESWTWAYFGFLNDPNFTGAENSLFLYKFMQTADFLYTTALSDSSNADSLSSNKTITVGKGLLYIGGMFPEFDKAGKWQSSARNLLFSCMDAQIYDDGSHIEQSPGYAFNISDDLLDSRQLDNVNGVVWPKKFRVKLANLMDSFWQFLSPNGTRPAIGDTYRNDSRQVFDKADLILGTTRWPLVKPRTRDVFVEGMDAVKPYLNNPGVQPDLGDRGQTYAMPVSGNYIMRSGNDSSARQIIFDAGPKGGSHGHYDLFNFELSGYGRPLISDPGAYKYDRSVNRSYVISTQAHNTINADGHNVATIETTDGSDIQVSRWRTDGKSAQITATHDGYNYLTGKPSVTRSMWFDLDNTILIVDWAQGTAKHNWQESFNLQTLGVTNNVTVDPANLTARTQYPDGGNVQIQGITTDETAVQGPLTFVTNKASGDYMDDAYRFTLNQSGKFVCFVTLVTTYNGTTPPNTTASLISDPGDGGTVRVLLTKNGKQQEVDFSRPVTAPLDSIATTRGTYNDIAFDSANRLHLVYADRDTGALMYAVRNANGDWNTPTIIDPAASNTDGGYQYISLAIDNTGSPGVAYFDGWNGDLRYAHLDRITGKWKAFVIDSAGSTGLYPSLAFSRENTPAISYYNHTNKDLELARSNGKSWSIAPVDTTGDVGRFSSLRLDPNRTFATDWAIGYEDTTNGNDKYAIQGDFDGGTQANGFTNYTVEDLADAGGFVSLAFYDSGQSGKHRYQPAMTYYDAGESSLRYSTSMDGGATWEHDIVASVGVQGLYTNLLFEAGGKANIFYYDRTNNEAIRAVLSHGNWTLYNLRAGGREIHASISSDGSIAYSSLNEKTGKLNVFVI